MEIAILMQKTMNQSIAIEDLKGEFLERAKKYYKDVLKFKLYNNNNDWQYITHLTHIRHAIAHANGRVDRLKNDNRNKIMSLKKQNIGVSIEHNNYIVLDSSFSWKTFSAVKSILENLISHYKIWDNKQNNV
jgi:hypothetical protein